MIFFFVLKLLPELIDRLTEGREKLGCSIDLVQISLFSLAIGEERSEIGGQVQTELKHAKLQLVRFILMLQSTGLKEEIKIGVCLVVDRSKRGFSRSFFGGLEKIFHCVANVYAKL